MNKFLLHLPVVKWIFVVESSDAVERIDELAYTLFEGELGCLLDPLEGEESQQTRYQDEEAEGVLPLVEEIRQQRYG